MMIESMEPLKPLEPLEPLHLPPTTTSPKNVVPTATVSSSVSVLPPRKIVLGDFKQRYTLAQRQREAQQMRTKYPDRIAVIVEYDPKYASVFELLDKTKYLVPHELSVGQLVYVLRKRVKLRPSEAMFVFVNQNIMLPTASNLASVYDKYKDPEDGFLYVVLASESTYGLN